MAVAQTYEIAEDAAAEPKDLDDRQFGYQWGGIRVLAPIQFQQ